MILVTGGAGYIGSHFVKEALRAMPEESIVIVDSLIEGHKEVVTLLGESERLHFVEADIGNRQQMTDVFQKYPIDSVVHFSAFAYVGESSKDPLKYYNNNVAKSIALFEAMEAHNIRKIVFSSTCATYGNPTELPINETQASNPVNVYGETKLMVEKVLKALHTYKNWSCIPLRYFNAAGADPEGQLGESHNPETHLIPLVLKTAKGELPAISIFGDDYDTSDGTCVRDYIHVNDLATAHLAALKYIKQHQVFLPINLGTARGASVKEVINICKKVTGKDIPVEVHPRREGDPAILVADAAKAKHLLGWVPRYTLEEAVETAWLWEINRNY